MPNERLGFTELSFVSVLSRSADMHVLSGRVIQALETHAKIVWAINCE